MKKVLVTGAAGSIGLNVLKYLLSEGKYEITALDLNNKKSIKNLKKYQNRINVVYGDVNDEILMHSLVKEHDYIIYLASVLPPLSDFNKSIGELIEYDALSYIIEVINKENKDCHLIYASSTSIYDNTLSASVKEVIKESELSNYSYVKYNSEKLITSKLKNYTILRVPLVLNNLTGEPFIYNVKKNLVVEVTTNIDAAYAFVKVIDYIKEVNKKTYNIGMGEEGRVVYNEILKNILNNYGLSMRYILSRIFLGKTYKSPILTDSDELDNIIHYRHDSLYNYYKRLKTKGKYRTFQKIIAKPLVFFKKDK